jgi:hypothetical protein
MATSAGATLQRLVWRLHEQTLDVANLRTALDIQRNRISHMYVELDVLPPARQRRQSLGTLLTRQPAHHTSR